MRYPEICADNIWPNDNALSSDPEDGPRVKKLAVAYLLLAGIVFFGLLAL